jgi:pimeloyl-ACP methyl ester carboxylesterase
MSGRGFEKLTNVSGGTETGYLRFGSGKKRLVIIPGLSIKSVLDSAGAVATAYRVFTDSHTVIMPDRPARVDPGTDVFGLAAHVAALLDSEGVKQADVLGVSQGGMIAQALALRRPDLVGRLALASTLSRPNPTAVSVINGWAALAARRDVRGLTEDFIEKIYTEGFAKKYGRFLAAMNDGVTDEQLDRFIALAACCGGFDVYGRLGEISCPCLVLCGADDRVTTAAAARETAEALGCDCLEFEGFSHAVYDEAPQFKEALIGFFL